MYQREDHRFVTAKELTQLGCILWLALFFFANDLTAHEGLMYLCVEVVSVGNDEEGEVAF